ncbi:MAG: FGGY family carbohydrate kinase [Spirochaetia bacterium]
MAGYVIGIDAGTESFRAGVFDAAGRCLGFGVSPNTTTYRHPGWAEQGPRDWDVALVESIRKALSASRVSPSQISGIGVDGTSCTVVFLDARGEPLRDALIWMDIRAVQEAADVAATGDPALRYTGHGNVSAEWFPCKVAWVKRNEPQVYADAATVFEETDWLAFRLTGERTVNINTTSVRWFFNNREGGLPVSLYKKMGLQDILQKVPSRVVKIGEVVGGLTREMALRTGLPEGIPVAGGAADAFIGVIGINALKPGTLALITGSSHLLIGVTDREVHSSGLWGSYPDAILPGLHVIEGGQVSTGSVVRWFTSGFVGTEITEEAAARGCPAFDILNERAAKIPAGSEGLVVLEHWQGSRAPWTDPLSRGVIRGLTLGHTPAHVYRAILEGVDYGTEVIARRMEAEGVRIDTLVACGGATQSLLWMQIHADVCGRPIAIPEEQQAVCLGSAIAATVAAGQHPDIVSAASAMVRVQKVVTPDPTAHSHYRPYVEQYIETYDCLKEASHRLVRSLPG